MYFARFVYVFIQSSSTVFTSPLLLALLCLASYLLCVHESLALARVDAIHHRLPACLFIEAAQTCHFSSIQNVLAWRHGSCVWAFCVLAQIVVKHSRKGSTTSASITFSTLHSASSARRAVRATQQSTRCLSRFSRLGPLVSARHQVSSTAVPSA